MEPPQRLPRQQVSNVLLYHGKYLCNNQIASLVQFIKPASTMKKVPYFTFETDLLNIRTHQMASIRSM
jgi:hypothetical protein